MASLISQTQKWSDNDIGKIAKLVSRLRQFGSLTIRCLGASDTPSGLAIDYFYPRACRVAGENEHQTYDCHSDYNTRRPMLMKSNEATTTST
jgi:hypothetical protein